MGHTQRRNSNTCQEPGPTEMSDGMRSTNICQKPRPMDLNDGVNETLRNSPAISVRNLALRTSVMGHDPCKKILFNVVFLVVVARSECVCGAVCGVCRCVWLCVLWLWLWSWCCTWVLVMTHIKKICDADCRCTSGKECVDVTVKYSVHRHQMDEWARHLHRLVHDGIDLELVGEPRAVVAALVQLHTNHGARMLYRTAPRASLPANSALSVPLSFADRSQMIQANLRNRKGIDKRTAELFNTDTSICQEVFDLESLCIIQEELVLKIV